MKTLFLSRFFILISVIFFLVSCADEPEAKNYLKVERSITYENYGSPFINLWKSGGFLFAQVSGLQTLKLDFEGNILDSINHLPSQLKTYVNNQNRIEFNNGYPEIRYKYFDENNVLVKTGGYNIENMSVTVMKIVHLKDKVIWICLMNSYLNNTREMVLIEIDANGNMGKVQLHDFKSWYIQDIYEVVASDNQICLSAFAIKNGVQHLGFVNFNSSLDTNWTKLLDIKYYGGTSVGATSYQNGDFGFFTNQRTPYHILFSEDGQNTIISSSEMNSYVENLNFLQHKPNAIGVGSYHYYYSDPIVEYSKSGQIKKTWVEYTEVYSACGIVETEDYYFVAGGNDNLQKPVLSIIKK